VWARSVGTGSCDGIVLGAGPAGSTAAALPSERGRGVDRDFETLLAAMKDVASVPDLPPSRRPAPVNSRPLLPLPLHDWSYRAALVCGAAPLLTGISIFLLWLVTRWDSLMLAGLHTIYAGLAAFAVGCIALTIYLWRAFRSPDADQRRVRNATLACGGLLLVNFPVAFGIVAAVIDIESRYTVVIHNDSGQPLEDVRVFGGGCDKSLGSIAPGDTVRRRLRFDTDGELRLHATIGTTDIDEVIDGYITRDIGGRPTVTVEPGGAVSVVHDHDQWNRD